MVDGLEKIIEFILIGTLDKVHQGLQFPLYHLSFFR
jgi:hypothetical protein